jgi:hypothetical protein
MLEEWAKRMHWPRHEVYNSQTGNYKIEATRETTRHYRTINDALLSVEAVEGSAAAHLSSL